MNSLYVRPEDISELATDAHAQVMCNLLNYLGYNARPILEEDIVFVEPTGTVSAEDWKKCLDHMRHNHFDKPFWASGDNWTYVINGHLMRFGAIRVPRKDYDEEYPDALHLYVTIGEEFYNRYDVDSPELIPETIVALFQDFFELYPAPWSFEVNYNVDPSHRHRVSRPYRINAEMLGEGATSTMARQMVWLLQAMGNLVAFTELTGDPNVRIDAEADAYIIVSSDWQRCLEALATPMTEPAHLEEEVYAFIHNDDVAIIDFSERRVTEDSTTYPITVNGVYGRLSLEVSVNHVHYYDDHLQVFADRIEALLHGLADQVQP